MMPAPTLSVPPSNPNALQNVVATGGESFDSDPIFPGLWIVFARVARDVSGRESIVPLPEGLLEERFWIGRCGLIRAGSAQAEPGQTSVSSEASSLQLVLAPSGGYRECGEESENTKTIA